FKQKTAYEMTGVQTCALPIFEVVEIQQRDEQRLRALAQRAGQQLVPRAAVEHAGQRVALAELAQVLLGHAPALDLLGELRAVQRSEERRVGKEWSAGWHVRGW